MQQINPEKATQLKVSTSEPEPQLEVKAVSRGPRVTGEELDALAEYMLANPQGDRKQPEYYAAFQAQVSVSLLPLCITISLSSIEFELVYWLCSTAGLLGSRRQKAQRENKCKNARYPGEETNTRSLLVINGLN